MFSEYALDLHASSEVSLAPQECKQFASEPSFALSPAFCGQRPSGVARDLQTMLLTLKKEAVGSVFDDPDQFRKTIYPLTSLFGPRTNLRVCHDCLVQEDNTMKGLDLIFCFLQPKVLVPLTVNEALDSEYSDLFVGQFNEYLASFSQAIYSCMDKLRAIYPDEAIEMMLLRTSVVAHYYFFGEIPAYPYPCNVTLNAVGEALGADLKVVDGSLELRQVLANFGKRKYHAQSGGGFWNSIISLFSGWFTPSAKKEHLVGSYIVEEDSSGEYDGVIREECSKDEARGYLAGILTSAKKLVSTFISMASDVGRSIFDKVKEFILSFLNIDPAFMQKLKYCAVGLVGVVIVTLVLTLINTGILTRSYLNERRITTAQDKDNVGFLDGIIKVVTGVCGWTMGHNIQRINTTMSFAGTVGRSIQAICKWALGLMPIALLKVFGISNPDLEQFHEKVAIADDLLNKASVPGATLVAGYSQAIRDCMIYFREIYLSKNTEKYPRTYLSTCSDYSKRLSKKLCEINGIEYRNTIKNPSLLLYISGDTGLAKTPLMQTVMDDDKFRSRLKTCTGTQVPQMVYSRNVEDPYWSGYQPNQFGVTMIDEAFNMTDAQLYQVEMNLLHLTGAAAYLLPMADINDGVVGKKGTGYDSNITVMIGNQTCLSSVSAHKKGCYTSLTRRINAEIHLVVKDQFKEFYSLEKGFDVDAFTKAYEGVNGAGSAKKFLTNYGHINFQIYPFAASQPVVQMIKTCYTFDDLKDYIIEQHNKMTRSVSSLVDYSNYINPGEVFDVATQIFLEKSSNDQTYLVKRRFNLQATFPDKRFHDYCKPDVLYYDIRKCYMLPSIQQIEQTLHRDGHLMESAEGDWDRYTSWLWYRVLEAEHKHGAEKDDYDFHNNLVTELDALTRCILGGQNFSTIMRAIRMFCWIVDPNVLGLHVYTAEQFNSEFKQLAIHYCHNKLEQDGKMNLELLRKNYGKSKMANKALQLIWYKFGDYYMAKVIKVAKNTGGKFIEYKTVSDCHTFMLNKIDVFFNIPDVPLGGHFKGSNWIMMLPARLTLGMEDRYCDIAIEEIQPVDNKYHDLAMKCLKVCSLALAVSGAFYAAKKLLDGIYSWFKDGSNSAAEEFEQPQAQRNVNNINDNYVNTWQTVSAPRKFSVTKQASDDPNIVAQSVEKLYFKCHIDGHPTHCIRVYDNWLLTYSHSRLRKLIRQEKSELEVGFEVNGKLVKHTIKYGDIVIPGLGVEKFDFVFFRITDCKYYQPAPKNNYKKFVSEKDLQTLSPTASFPVRMTAPDGRKMYSYASLEQCQPYDGPDNTVYCLDNFVLSHLPTVDGDCGLPLIALIHGKHSVIGMHVAGNEFDEVAISTVITQETIINMCDIPTERDEWITSSEYKQVSNHSAVVKTQSDELPNLVASHYLPKSSQNFQPSETKLKKTIFCDNPNWYPVEKRPAQPMTGQLEDGTKVVDVMIREMGEFKQPEKLDQNILNRCYQDALKYYRKHTQATQIPWREKTEDEAVEGSINLAPMDLGTSPGYPWAKLVPGNGKRGCIQRFDGEEILYNQEYWTCLQRTLEIYNNNGSIDEVPHGNIFTCNAKDELLKLSKIEQGRTRSINCSPLHIAHAMRMKFGCLLEMLNNMGGESAIGMDPHSAEFHKRVYHYLCNSRPQGKGFIAGDYKAFDKHYVREILDLAFEVLHSLVPEGYCTDAQWKFFKDSQTEPELIILNKIYKFDTLQYSGCLLTTALNNLINRLYISYCYYDIMGYGTTYGFNDNVKAIYMGDDHLLYVDPKVRGLFNQITISKSMEKLNQVYTDDKKSAVMEPFQDFDDVTFMGCHPKMHGGIYYGALRQITLQNHVNYIMTNDSLDVVLDTFVGQAALWGREYFSDYTSRIKKIYPKFQIPSYDSCIKRYTRKVKISAQHSNSGFKAQSAEIVDFVEDEGGEVLEEEEVLVPITTDSTALCDTEQQDFHTGMESWLLKGVFKWSTDQNRGAVLYQTQTSEPWSLLSLTQNDLQVLGLKNFQYWKGTVEILFQLNCVQSQGGALVVTDFPLAEDIEAYSGVNSLLYMPSGILSPATRSTSYVLSHPFSYCVPYAECNINASDINYPTLFKFSLRVLSQLTGSASNATVSVYMRIKDCELKVPRNPNLYIGNVVAQSEMKETAPVKTAPKNKRPNRRYPIYRNRGRNQWSKRRRGPKRQRKQQAQQITKDTVISISTTPGERKIEGSVPQNLSTAEEKKVEKQGEYKVAQKKGIFYPSNKLKKEIAKLDSEKVAGVVKKVGANLFYKAANTVMKNKLGISIDQVLDLFNNFDRETIIEMCQHMYPQLSSLSNGVGPISVTSMQLNPNADYILGRTLVSPSDVQVSELLEPFGLFKFFNWSVSDAEDSTLTSFPIRSDMGYISDAGVTTDVPMNMALLHAFQYFKCTFVIRVFCFKSAFHSGRLRATIGYGITATETSQSQGITYSHILDFSDNTYADFEIPFRIPTEYMVTFGGPAPYFKYLLEQGNVTISVANALVNIGETSAENVECALAVSYRDCSVALPRPVPLCTGYTNDRRYYYTAQDMDEHDADQDGDEVVECNHFEYKCEDLLTYWRRMYLVPYELLTIDKVQDITSALKKYRVRLVINPWILPLSEFFNSFSGSINVRIATYSANEIQGRVGFYPINTQLSNIAHDSSLVCQRCYGQATEVPINLHTNRYIDLNLPYQHPVSFLTKQNPTFGVVEFLLSTNESYLSPNILQVYLGLGDDAQFGCRCLPTGGACARMPAKPDSVAYNQDGLFVATA